MKKVLAILLAVVLLSACRKEKIVQVDVEKNPLLISVSVNGSTSEIVRVK